MADSNFRGKRVALKLYEDACNLTSDEKDTYMSMLSKGGYATGINILDDNLWIDGDSGVEFVVPPSGLFYNKPFGHINKELADKLYEIAKLDPVDILKENIVINIDNTNLME